MNDPYQFVLTNARLSYAYLHEPYVSTDNDGKVKKTFTAHGIIPANDPQVASLMKLIKLAAADEFKEQAEQQLVAMAGKQNLFLKQGDIAKPGEEAYAGKVFVSLNSKVKPTLVESRNGVNVLLTAADNRPYSGCYANIIGRVWVQNNQWGKRVNAQLMGVQFLRHGEAFGGGRVAAATEFPVVEAEGADAAPPTAAGAPASAGVDPLLAGLLGS